MNQIVKDQLNVNCDVENGIIYNTEVLKSKLCSYNDPYILVKGNIITAAPNNLTPVAFKNCTQFTKYITKIDGTTVDDAEDLDLVMPIHNLI